MLVSFFYSEGFVAAVALILDQYMSQIFVQSFRLIQSKPGPGCLKLTTSLVNETLKFQT